MNSWATRLRGSFPRNKKGVTPARVAQWMENNATSVTQALIRSVRFQIRSARAGRLKKRRIWVMGIARINSNPSLPFSAG